MRGRSSHGNLSSQDGSSSPDSPTHNAAPITLGMVYFGGTILMTVNKEGAHIPFFTPLDIAYYQALSESDLPKVPKERLTNRLLHQGSNSHTSIMNAIASSYEGTEQQFGEALLNNFGFYKAYQKLAFDPIDSIVFDAESHLPSLLREVKFVMNKGHVPIILGGTDSLSKYGPLLQAELAHAGADHLPVVIVSSMCAFGDTGEKNQNHVVQLFKAAKMAAHQLVGSEKTGVYALVPENIDVTAASLISLAAPVEKISGNVVKAFVGLDTTPIDLERAPLTGTRLPLFTVSEISIDTPPQSLSKRVMLPIDAFNNPAAVIRSLQAINAKEPLAFDAIIIKGLPVNKQTIAEMSEVVDSLQQKGVDVAFVGGFKYSNKEGQLKPILKEGELAAKAPLLETLLASGARFLADTSSTQAYIQASMGNLPEAGTSTIPLPAYDPAFYTARAAQIARQEDRRDDALGMEFFPNSTASKQTLTVLSEAGIHVVLSNYTQGAMPPVALPEGLECKPTVTFHTAGKQIATSDTIEAAALDGGYAPHEKIRNNVIEGRDVKPKDLLNKVPFAAVIGTGNTSQAPFQGTPVRGITS